MDSLSRSATGHPHPTTRARSRVHCLGLDTREVLIIESLFRARPELGARYQFGAPPDGETADILFVNGDDPASRQAWQTLHAAHPGMIAVIVTARPESFPGQTVLVRPLNFRDFPAILAAITAVGSLRAGPSAHHEEERLRVLVVDDSFPARQFMKFKLESLGTSGSFPLDVDFAESGEQAVGMASGALYDLVFLDVEMPGIDGYEACRQLKALKPMRVAMLTGRIQPEDFTHGHAAGCDNYLTKPPNDTDLRSVLRLTSLRKQRALPTSPVATAPHVKFGHAETGAGQSGDTHGKS